MLDARWMKVFADLWQYPARTVLVALSIAAGVFAVGVVTTVKPVLLAALHDSYVRTNPASAIIYTDGADDRLIEKIRRVPGVKSAAGVRTVTAQLRLPGGETKDFVLTMIPDFAGMEVNRIFPESGAWPPQAGQVLVERSSLAAVKAGIGDTLAVTMPGGVQRTLQIGGTMYDVHRPLAAFSLRVFGAVSSETMAALGQPVNYNTIHVAIAGNATDAAEIRRVTNLIRDVVGQSGHQVTGTKFPPLGRPPAQLVVTPLVMTLQTIALFALLLSGLLITNTVSAVMTEQTRQVGMMKAIGASRAQITGIYLAEVTAFGLLSLVIAVPLSAMAAGQLIGFLTRLFNIDSGPWSPPAPTLVLQLVLAIGLPLLTALVPILRGTAVSVRDAVNDYGIRAECAGAGTPTWWNRAVSFLPPSALLSFNNTFRRSGRLIRTVLVLVIAGAVFTGILSVRQSLLTTLDRSLGSSAFDLQLAFEQPARLEALRKETRQIPGVAAADGWLSRWVTRVRPGGDISKDFALVALDPQSPVIRPVLVEGRWLTAADQNAVVVNVADLSEEPDIRVGQTISLKLGTETHPFRVVGIARNAFDDLYVPYAYYARLTGQEGQANRLMVRAEAGDRAAQAALGDPVRRRLESAGTRVATLTVMAAVRHRVVNQFNAVVAVLLVMAGLLALVGSLGLAGTMGINVLERTREIGVMRAIGASNWAVMRVFLSEGVFIGVISWVLAALAAGPVGLLLLRIIQVADMKAQPAFTFSLSGLVIWLVLIGVLSATASFLPAWRASRLRVREVLAYE